MFKRFLLFFFLIQLYVSNAQKEGAIWYFGENAGLDFNSGSPVALTNSQHYILEGCATISNPNGELLLYSDGLKAWNKNNQIMPNGDGLLGDSSSSQSAIIVPHPGDINKYYIFTVNANYNTFDGSYDGLNYSLVDLTLDGGSGDIIPSEKNVKLLTTTAEKLTAVKKSDTEYWIITRYFDTFYTFKVDINGIDPIPIQTKLSPEVAGVNDFFFGRNSAIGYMKISPDGSKLALAVFNMLYPFQNFTISDGGVYLYDFDINTGTPSNPQLLSDILNPYGIEFSPDSSKLYATVGFGFFDTRVPNGSIVQFDLDQVDIPNSKSEIVSLPYKHHPSTVQLAIDGKIYFSYTLKNDIFSDPGDWSEYMSVIENPNEVANNLNISMDAIYLGGNSGLNGLPTFISSFFNIGFTFDKTCLGDATEFQINSSEPITTISWDFGDGNSSTLENPTHMYLTPGTYTVNVTANTATDSKVETKEVTIYEIPISNNVSNFEVCTSGPTYDFNLASKDAEVLGVQLATEYLVSYYPTFIDAQSNTNRLPTLYANSLATETIFARIQNANNTSCFDTTSFDLIIQKAPTVNTQDDWTVCDTDMDGFHTFDLTEKTTSILVNNDPTEFDVSYYLNQFDLDNKINPILINYTNTIPREEIFWRIENNSYPTCYGEGTFFLEVILGVTANTPANFEVCDTDNDGFFLFDLTTKEAEILGAQNTASSSITFHSTLLEAENGSNPLNKNSYTNSTAYNETLFVRVENIADSSCYDTSFFELQVSDTPLAQTVTNWQVCDNNNDGVFSFNLAHKTAEILGNQSATDYTLSYHNSLTDAQTNQNNITGIFSNTSRMQTIFYRLENNANSSCFITSDFALEVYDTPTANSASPIVQCDTDESGSDTFDLSQKDQEVLIGQDATIFQVSYFSNEMDAINNQNQLSKSNYENTNLEEVIYARVQHTNLETCFDVSSFQLSIRALPQPNLEEQYVICPDSPELIIDGGDFESWVWRDAQNNEISTDRILSVTSLGDYSLTVSHSPTGLTCEKTVEFEVVSSGAPEDFSTEIKDFSDLVRIEVDATGIGEFEYSSDGENFQDSSRLEVFPGTHTIYVRDKFLCRTITKEVIALGFQKFFTPNGDGTHEYWNIIGAENFPNSQIYIFDRQGKLLKQLSPESRGWDGTFQGVQLPASDYWFRFINEDGSVHTGHFSLKR